MILFLGGVLMVTIEISKEVYRRLMALKKIVDVVLKDEFKDDSEYAEFVLLMGIEKMIVDPLPENDLLRKTVVAMFRENPEFIADFIARTLEKGGMREEERREWRSYTT